MRNNSLKTHAAIAKRIPLNSEAQKSSSQRSNLVVKTHRENTQISDQLKLINRLAKTRLQRTISLRQL